MPALYITGTDTGAGKTQVTASLLHALRKRGLRVAGMKPVASGCTRDSAGWRNEDALALQAASSAPIPDYALINPIALPLPTAPEIAARAAGVEIALPAMLTAWRALAPNRDVLLVEGVGGWWAPLAPGFAQADLARAFGIEQVLLVVGLRVGCLNHARLSAHAIATDGMPLLGWIGSVLDPTMPDVEDYLQLLRRELVAPCLGVLPHRAHRDPAALCAHIAIDDLLQGLGMAKVTSAERE